jgi:hypothetical protein
MFFSHKLLKYSFIVGIFFTFFFFTSSVYATDYYVSTTGSNANPGTSTGQAWQTLEYAASQIAAGDDVFVLAGTYNLAAPLVFDNLTANSGNPTTIQPYNNAVVVIDGKNLTH